MARRIAACEATAGTTCRLVMNPTSSSAKTLVGSAIASISVLPWRLTGRTSYLRAICSGTSLSTSGSMSSCESVIDWMPYWRDRKAISFSSVTKLSLTKMLPSLSLDPFCSWSARANCSLSMSPSRTRRSPRRRLTGCPSLGSAMARGPAGLLARPGEAPEGVREGLKGLVLIENEGHLLQRCLALAEVIDDGRDHDIGGLRRRHASHAGAQRGERDRGHLVLLGDGEGRARRGDDLVGVGLEVAAHGGSMDHVRGGQIAGHGEHGLARLDRPLAHGLLLDDGAALPLNRACDAGPHPELGIGRIDDRVDLGLRDVAAGDRDGGAADLDLHRPLPCLPPASSRALAASHARSSSCTDASSSFRPSAVIVASTSLNRRVNVSAACLRQSSASMSSSRATFVREKSKSPSSARIRSASPATIASSASATSSRTFAHAWVQSGQSKPTRPALTCRRWARSSAGRLCGTPSSADRDAPLVPASACLIRSHWLRTSWGPSTRAVPKTWG